MLLNNLDPEVAERPEELVVYGGSGRAARSHDALRAIVRTLLAPRRRRDAARPERQAGRRLPHARGRAARADRELAARARAGRPGTSSAGSRREGLTMFGQMTAGQLDLHRHAGDPAGHLPDVRRRGREALRLGRPQRPDDPDRRARRDGRRAAARGDDGGRRDPLRRGRSVADRAPARDALPRRGRRLARRRARARARGRRARGGRSRSGCSGTRPRSCRSWRDAASPSTSSPTRRRRTTR